MINTNSNSRGSASRCPTILDIKIDDPAVIDELKSRDTLEAKREYGEELMELGARVVRTHRPVTAADQVTEAFRDFQERSERDYDELSSKLEEKAVSTQATVTEVYERAERVLKSVLEELEEGASRSEERTENVVGHFKERLEGTLRELGQQVSRAEQVIAAGLEREQALITQQNLRNQSSSKGTSFEERVKNQLQNFGRGRGDLVELTGTKSSAGTSSKKGDIFYQMKVGDRVVPVVIECKDEKLAMRGTNPFQLPGLETSMRERGGEYGIVVANLKQNSDEDGPRFPALQMFGQDRFVVLVDRDQEHAIALETALQLIQQRASEKKQGSEVTMDIAAVSQAIENIQITSEQFRGLKTTCTNLGTQLARMRSQLDELDHSLDDQTLHLKSLLGLAA